MNKADKIMEDAFGYEFEDVRTSKKKRKKVKKSVDTEEKSGIITSNDEGFEIIHSPNFVSWQLDKKRNRWQHDPNKPVSEWKSWDLFEFTHRLYLERYNKDWDLLRAANARIITQIFAKLEKELGSNNYLFMRDYVVYFFEKHIDKFLRKDNERCSLFDYMNRKDTIKSFCSYYNHKINLLKYEKIKTAIESEDITNADLEKAFVLSVGTLVSDYGIVLAANWLVTRKHFKKKEAIRTVHGVCKSMYDKGVFDIVVKSTEKHSPYPDWLSFKKPSIITNKINTEIKINVEFLESEKKRLDFLKERG